MAARRHKSVSHGVAILEAAQLLAAAGYAVDDDPQALLTDDAAPWRVCTEPDLAFNLKGEWWPVKVQREISTRTLDKWRKTLEFTGRLALVLYHEEARKKQAGILTAARFRLPKGVIWLSSLEQMEGGAWDWQEITTTGRTIISFRSAFTGRRVTRETLETLWYNMAGHSWRKGR